jgi:hypothetical protein
MSVVLRQLRPLLFFVIIIFVVLPMLVYNVFTIDFDPIPTSSTVGIHGQPWTAFIHDAASVTMATTDPVMLPAYLQSCWNLSSDVLEDPEQLKAVERACAPDNSTVATKHMPLVHFVYVPIQSIPLLDGEQAPEPENFTFIQYAAFQSIRKALKPEMMILHYTSHQPIGYWYTQCQRHLSLHRVLWPQISASIAQSMSVYERRDVLQYLLALRALRKQGGVAFTDFNTMVVRPFAALWRMIPVFGSLSSDEDKGTNAFSVSTHMLASRAAGDAYVSFLESELQRWLESIDDTTRLEDRPDISLEHRVGTLTLAYYANVSESTNVVVLAASEVFDGVPLTKLVPFLHATMHDTDSDINFQRMTAFRLRHDVGFAGSAMQRIEERLIVNDETMAQDKTSLLGVILRYVTTTNGSAEIDRFLYS